MKKFFVRLILFFIFIIAAQQFIDYLFIPYHWGNYWYSAKIRHLKNTTKKYNTFFIGSSKSYRQIDPVIFDSVVNKTNMIRVNSFNLGAPSTFCPEHYFLYEKLLSEPSISSEIKYIIIELKEIRYIRKYRLHTEKITYWHNWKDFKFAARAFNSDTTYTKKKARKHIKNYFTSYIENLINIGQYKSIIFEKDLYDPKYVGKNKDGYYPLEDELKETTKKEVKNNFIKRNNHIKKNPTVISKKAKQSIQSMDEIEIYNAVHLERIKNIIELSERKGITILFLLSTGELNKRAVGLYKKVPEQNKIELLDARKYPELYDVNYYFDSGHFTKEGNKTYTSLLAKKFIEKVKVINQ